MSIEDLIDCRKFGESMGVDVSFSEGKYGMYLHINDKYITCTDNSREAKTAIFAFVLGQIDGEYSGRLSK